MTPCFSKTLVAEFWTLWRQGEYTDQRLGQAFYNYFDMHKMDSPPSKLYEASDNEARSIIKAMTDPSQ